MNLYVQRNDKSIYLCDVNHTVIAHFPNILNMKNQRQLLKYVAQFIKTWVKQLDRDKLIGIKDDVDSVGEVVEDDEKGIVEPDKEKLA